MASDEGNVARCVGDVIDSDGNAVSVLCAPDGTVVVMCLGNFGLEPDVAAEFRELLDRAAMPGQVPPVAEARSVPGEPAVRQVTLWLCDPCLDGHGGECHTPGCSLWINRAPDFPLRDNPGVTVHAEPAEASGCPHDGCSADVASALAGLPPKWCAGKCEHVMCATPDDCVNGPEPHPLVPPLPGVDLPCCRQPWEATVQPQPVTVAGELAAAGIDLGQLGRLASDVGRLAGGHRPCCDHCDNSEGPAGHDYGDAGAHDGPCEACADEAGRAAAAASHD